MPTTLAKKPEPCKHKADLQKPHLCPYKNELGKTNEICEELCRCCVYCEGQCARDI